MNAETPVKLVVAGCPDLIHQHCVFCGAVIPEMATWDWDTVCKSPLNDLPPDTVGNRHHAYLRWKNKQSVLEVRANQLLAGKGPTAQ